MPDYTILGLLARGPASGYDLGKWLRTDGRWLGRGTSMTPVYRALADIESRGWVSTRVEPRENAPAATVYSLTPAGVEALEQWAASEYRPDERPMSPEFTQRLSFAGQLGPRYALTIVRTELDFRRRQRAAEQDPVLPSEGAQPIPEIDRDWLTRIDALTHDRGWQSTSLFIGWLETTERELVRECERRGLDPSPIDRTPTSQETR
ncbi:PadR family transcriptional regulator [Brachybacterium kimchii]|uniref:PadR family transcriptional regulator n=1 Tax=Brachybacterium kimchii TaxID=2942909 RepID=A0ABY4N503_9MICO|nr:PadR family transcriptional regulator [Brachybacterium kimchii]UQN28399.1 PadR family transcriptional regulator [Brachybacterium kimchii]